VTDVPQAEAFYGLVGFHRRGSPDAKEGIVSNDAGLTLTFVPSTLPPPDGKNILMDMPGDCKYPGINHMSFGVPSVSSTKSYLHAVAPESISGTRGKGGNLAVFIRDPSRNTLEFERNDGVDNTDPVDATVLSSPPRGGIDHVGIRVADAAAAAEWYGKTLGFSRVTHRYNLDDDPLKNSSPWIIRTSNGPAMDINLIPNCSNKLAYNALLPPSSKGNRDIYPGIIYVAFTVKSVQEARTALSSMGVDTYTDAEVEQIGLPKSAVTPVQDATALQDCTDSLFLCDPDRNIIRIVGPP